MVALGAPDVLGVGLDEVCPDEALRELEEAEVAPVLGGGVPLERGEGHEEEVLGGEDDEVAHLAAVGPDLGRVLVGPVVEGDVVEGAVRPAVEQVEVAELQPQTLVRLSCE